MERILLKILITIVCIPLILILLYTAIYPEEGMLLGRRWQFKNEDLEPSEMAVKLARVSSIVGLVLIGLILIFS